MATPSRTEIISLFRSLLRSARQFPDYNIREYTKRRTIDAFRDSKTLSDPSSIAAAFSDGQSQLQIGYVAWTKIQVVVNDVLIKCASYIATVIDCRGARDLSRRKPFTEKPP
ncbi:hypothetical protein L1987_08420 [Smallanthus sonchifolius]|uniref:Uncharacterized protein n=1 Tax=Smallanthus sonchifolius TaxID=185202 RepID=A0ACB9JM98_9ASTR|nr:hypothetical protein L1987_08420 [Smallanthus sonchifolius]